MAKQRPIGPLSGLFHAVPVTYTRGLDLSGSLEGAGGIGGLLARSHDYFAGNWTSHNYYHADGMGNITALVSPAGNLVARYTYDPYGRTISVIGGTLAAANVYRFSSKELHTRSGMYHYGFRFYDPAVQRWLNRDPIGEDGGVNLYGFVANNSVNGVDVMGLEAHGFDVLPDRYGGTPLYHGDSYSEDLSYFLYNTGAAIYNVYKFLTWQDPEVLGGSPAFGATPATSIGTGVRFTQWLRKCKLPAARKVSPPNLKDSPFGPKIADPVPGSGVPRNWTKDQIADAITDYQASIASRKAEQAAFDAVGGGNATQRLAHAQRITEEESFLQSLIKALETRK